MRWFQCNSFLAVMASVLTFLPGQIVGFRDNSSYMAANDGSNSGGGGVGSLLFSDALKSMKSSRLYDTSLSSSIIRLIRELMLTPKVYENMINSGAERRADHGHGRVLFPGESQQSQSQGRSSSIMFANPMPVRSSRQSPTPTFSEGMASNSETPGLRAMALSSRTIDSIQSSSSPINNFNANSNDRVIVNGVPGALITRNGYRQGKVERVPRPIIINGNDAAINAPRYNRMLEGPAPTVGGSAMKIPKPSVIMSQPLRIIEGNRDSRGRSLKEIDVQGVRVIVGQRVPDDPEDKLFTWRNGRVIKGMFFPNDPSNSRPMNQEQSNDISSSNSNSNSKAPPGSFIVSSAYNF